MYFYGQKRQWTCYWLETVRLQLSKAMRNLFVLPFIFELLDIQINLFGTMRYVQTFHIFISDVKVLEGIVAFVMKKGSQYSQLFNYM